MRGRNNIEMDTLAVTVDAIADQVAHVIDQFGRAMRVRIDRRTAKGPRPVVGEKWLLARSGGGWVFSVCLRADLPVVSGSTDNSPALKSLLAALESMGLIIDNTDNEQVNARHGHTHDVPSHSTGGGGDPGHTHGVAAQATDPDENPA